MIDNRERYDYSEIKEDSNYRQFYCADHAFFTKVILKEVTPFHFKLNVFTRAKNSD